MASLPVYGIDPPLLAAADFTEQESDGIRFINASLARVSAYRDNFSAALSLLEFSEARLEAMRLEPAAAHEHPNHERWWTDAMAVAGWKRLAARDGAMSIYHTAMAIAGIRSSLVGCPSLSAGVDAGKLRAGARLLRRAFPAFEGVRHGVAHSAEMTSTPDRYRRNMYRGPPPGDPVPYRDYEHLFLAGSLRGDEFEVTWEGKLISYKLSRASLGAMDTAIREFFAGFASVQTSRASFRWKD